MNDAVSMAAEMREWAARVRAEADLVEKAADILDPKPRTLGKPRRRRRSSHKPEQPPAPKPIATLRTKEGTRIDLGTAGHTSHPSDPDAEAIRDNLAHTTEEGMGTVGRRF